MTFFKERSQDLLGRGDEDSEAASDITSCCNEPNGGLRMVACKGCGWIRTVNLIATR